MVLDKNGKVDWTKSTAADAEGFAVFLFL